MPNNPNNLMVLTRARAFAVDLHRAVERRERLLGRASPGLRNQMLRASMSIPLNIAEGAGKDTRAEFAQFVGHAIGSANEVEQQMLLAQALAPVADPKRAFPLAATQVNAWLDTATANRRRRPRGLQRD